MRMISSYKFALRSRIELLLSLGLLGVAACATPGESPPAELEKFGESGFEITQDLRVGGSLRSDFAKAIRHIEQEQYESGIELLEKVAEAVPYAVGAHFNLALAYGRVDRLEAAEVSIRKALELAPRHPAVLNELGIILRRSGRFDKARQSYEEALQVYPEFHYVRRNLAILCDLYLSDLPCAIEHYEIYLHAVPEDEMAAMWIVDLRNRAGR
jgi:tetratricopeptide (TPR) repeat protein